MLVQFKVGNYLSFKEPQTLSLVASSDDSLPQNTFQLPDPKGLVLVKSAAIYGANASGKSNLLRALLFMKSFVESSAARHEGEPISVTPFRLDPAYLERPSEFEVVFIHEGERYEYGFTADRQRVHEEWLSAAKMGSRMRSRMLFYRPAKGKPEFGPSWRGRAQVVAEQTRANALLLSVAAQLNNPIAARVTAWFRDGLRGMPAASASTDAFMAVAAIEQGKADAVCRFLRAADLGIEGCRVDEVPASEWFALPAEMREALSQQLRDGKAETFPQPRTLHRGSDGSEVVFDLMGEESGGTQRLFALSGWLLLTVGTSGVLVVDELDSSLHPAMTRFLLESVHASPSRSQLVFATHDCTLLDRQLLRRDQIWFTEKAPTGATKLYSLWDFKLPHRPRQDENFQGRYLQGRYGAVPYVGEWSVEEHQA